MTGLPDAGLLSADACLERLGRALDDPADSGDVDADRASDGAVRLAPLVQHADGGDSVVSERRGHLHHPP